MGREKLFGMTLNELVAVTRRSGLPGYSAKQIADWLYRKEIRSISEMSNLSTKARELLSEHYEFGLTEPAGSAVSSDGTKKYLYRVLENKYIETAYIPEDHRATVCLSSQCGCKMGCIFCMTGKQGFQGNLSSNEILNQFRSLPEFRSLTNIVYMGMGEPLDNLAEVLKSLEILTSDWGYGWSPSRITVSTIGLTEEIKEYLEKSRCHLAVSLHSPFDEERKKLIPVQKTNELSEVLEIIRAFDLNRQRRISFEYILFKGMNDTPRHIKEMARILNRIRCRVNLIRYHNIPGSQLESPDMSSIVNFRDSLNAKGIPATIRTSRGEDIQAACGLLSTLEQNRMI